LRWRPAATRFERTREVRQVLQSRLHRRPDLSGALDIDRVDLIGGGGEAGDFLWRKGEVRIDFALERQLGGVLA
jgi:hypothetical protein